MMLSLSLSAILVVVSFSFACGAVCPWDDDSLVPWSSLNADPTTEIVIDVGVIYDESSLDDYIGIRVVNGGKFVFKPNVKDLTLRTHYIIVQDGGRVDIGAKEEECRYSGNLNILLLGDRDDEIRYQHFGDKVIGVDKGGSFNAWGRKKVSFTTLEAPLFKMEEDGMLFREEVTQEDKLAGLIVYRFDPTHKGRYSAEDVKRDVFNFKAKSDKSFKTNVDNLDKYFKETKSGDVVVAVIRKSLMSKDDVKVFTDLYQVIASFLGVPLEQAKISELEFYDGYVLIKEQDGSFIEETTEYRSNGRDQHSSATLIVESHNKKFFANSYTSIRGHGKSKTLVEVTDTEYSVPTIELTDDISSWKRGDRLLITTPNGDNEATEFGTIVEEVDDHHVTIDLTAKHDHAAGFYKGIDIRSHVINGNRDIGMESRTFGLDGYGGHAKCGLGFKECNFADVSLKLMGSHFPKGRYPIHFHLAENVGDKAIVDSVFIEKSYARCVVVHFTHGLQVSNNACFDFIGHGFLTEDGAEVGNKFYHNIAVAPRRAGQPNNTHLIPTDKNPAGFFITSPDNELEDNVAVASEGDGFTFAFPNRPLDDSAVLSDLPEGQIFRTNIKSFKRNTAYSNDGNGVSIGVTLKADGNLKSYTEGFAPREDPTDPKSDLATLELSCITAYGNGDAQINVKAADVSLKHIRVAKGIKGVQLSRSIPRETYEQTVHDGVILGSRTKDQDEEDEDDTERRVGLEFVGTVSLSELYFDDFYKSENYKSGALGFAAGNKEVIAGNVMNKDIYFGFQDPDEGNRVASPETDDDRKGNYMESFVDADGFVTGVEGATVLRDTEFQFTDNCFKAWNDYAVCEDDYVTLDTNRAAVISRIHGEEIETLDLEKKTPFKVIADNDEYQYLVHYDVFNSKSKPSVMLRTFGAYLGKKFMIGFCVPKGDDVEFEVKYSGGSLTSEDSFDELQNSAGDTFFYDNTEGVLFVKFSGHEYEKCDETKESCRSYTIRMKKGSPGINDCVQTKKRVIEQEKKRKMALTKAEKRILSLIQQLEDLNDADKDRKRKLKKRAAVDFDVYTGDFPDMVDTCKAPNRK